MPRLRNRVRRRVAAPIGEPADGEQEEPEDESDAEEQESELGRPDATVRALREDAYRRRTGSGGELGDIAPSEISDLSQQVTTGTAASVNISDQFDPGFTRTEIVNRLGMVLSLSFSYDYGAGEWVPDPIDKTESQAIQQQLAEDKATDNVEDVVDPGDGAQTNPDGDLELDDGGTTVQKIEDTEPTEKSGVDYFSVDYAPDANYNSIYIDWDPVTTAGAKVSVIRQSDRIEITEISWNPDGQLVPGPFDPAETYEVNFIVDSGTITIHERDLNSQSLDTGIGKIDDFEGGGITSKEHLPMIEGWGPDEPAEEGTAKSTFDNPCTASSVRSAQYDVCSRSKDVTIDLFEGDPDDPDSILLRDDISQREDIVDIPDSRTDLQYRITIERGPDGETPKVSRLGHQLIR